MSFGSILKAVGNAISGAADAVAGAVETVVETAAEVVSTVVETVGTTLANGLDAAGNAAGNIPVIGGVLETGIHWLATVTSATFDFAATAVKGALDLAANVTAGLIRITVGGIGGLLAWDGRVFVKGVSGIGSGVAGAVIAVAAKAVAAVQATFFLQLGERQLTDHERTLLERIYRNSLDLYNIRVIDGWTLFSAFDRAPTIGNRIYMGGSANTGNDGALYEQTIVHECCHIWQYKHIGTRYVSDCMWAWLTQPDQGYEWQSYIDNGVQLWQDLNTEAQAEFIQEVAVGRRNMDGVLFIDPGVQVPPKGETAEFFENDPIGPEVDFQKGGVHYTDFARVSAAYLRSQPWYVATP